MTPLITKIADSQTRSAPSESAMKLGSPGVSIRLIFVSRHSNEASDAEMDMPRDFSVSSASETVVPSATEPSRVVAPASNSRALGNDVFPLPRWPTRATLRILSAACGMPWRSSLPQGRRAVNATAKFGPPHRLWPMDHSPRLDLRSLMARAEAAAPVGVVDAVGAALLEMLGARGVSFLIADFSGRSLTRLGHTGAGERQE